MKSKIKFIFILLTCLFIISTVPSCKSKVGRNPYREAKVRPSERQMRQDKKAIAKGNKNYKKAMRSNRKRLFGSKTDPGAPKSRK